VTIHVGDEVGEYGIAEIRELVSTLRPDRIGHGMLAARGKRLMRQISEAGIMLELCPTSTY
jgi:adenosine deaminase